MDIESLFLHKVSELRGLLKYRGEYDLLKVAAILRHLLLDEHNLLHAANRNIRWKVRFSVGCAGVVEHYASIFPEKPTLFTVEDGIDPETSPRRGAAVDLSLSQFLEMKIAIVEKIEYSVRDTISFGANTAGGVHHHPKSDESREMHAASNMFNIMGLPLFVRLLGGISRVVEKSIRPVEMLILRSQSERLTQAGRFGGAEQLWRRALDLCQETYGDGHPEFAYVLHNLGLNVHRQGRFKEAEELDRRSLEILRKEFGEDHNFTLSSRYNLAIDLQMQERYEEAAELLRICVSAVKDSTDADMYRDSLNYNLQRAKEVGKVR